MIDLSADDLTEACQAELSMLVAIYDRELVFSAPNRMKVRSTDLSYTFSFTCPGGICLLTLKCPIFGVDFNFGRS